MHSSGRIFFATFSWCFSFSFLLHGLQQRIFNISKYNNISVFQYIGSLSTQLQQQWQQQRNRSIRLHSISITTIMLKKCSNFTVIAFVHTKTRDCIFSICTHTFTHYGHSVMCLKHMPLS